MTDDRHCPGSSSPWPELGESSHQITFDPEADSISETVIRAIAVLTDTPPTRSPVLREAIDPDALDALFATRRNGAERAGDWFVEFPYDAFAVRIFSAGVVTLTPTADGRE